MTDPRQPEAEPEADLEATSPTGSFSLDAARMPRGVEFTDPLSPKLYAWLNDFTKATRSVRVYAENNAMFHKFVERAFRGLSEIFLDVAELNFSVREDRLLYNGDPVHVNPDREEGLPFVLYRNAFRRITLLRGVTQEEMVQLMRAITTDYSAGADYANEDLVTSLWRLALPHLRYLTIDSITALGQDTADKSDEEAKRIQASIEDIVAAIYRNNAADDDDVVAGVSITKEDLEALKEIRLENPEDLEVLDRFTERAIADIPPSQLELVRNEVSAEQHDDLVRRVMDIFLHILFREQSSRESTATIQIIQQLFESMVFGGRYDEARELVERLRHSAVHGDDLREMHISKHLVQMFASENRVVPVLEAFNDEYKTSSVADKIRFLRALGPSIAPILLRSLETLTTPGHRRLICELIIECGVPEPVELMRHINGAKWFAVRDILSLAQQHPPERISALIASGLRHDHPKVRQYAVGMLRTYARGPADQLLSERLRDSEIDVRLAATRVAAARRSAPCRAELERMLSDESVFEREPRELRTLMTAYGAIAHEEAVPLLDGLLSPGFFTRLKSLDVQIAAAFALASIGGADASAALQKGARTLSTKVREACKRALARDLRKGERPADILAGHGLRIPDVATTNPNEPLPERSGEESATPSGGTAIDPTPPRGNSMDIDFTIGSTSDVQDMLSGAPQFTLDLKPEDGSTQSLNPVDRERPSMPRVDPHYPVRESMPSNLPPAQRALTGAPRAEVTVTQPMAAVPRPPAAKTEPMAAVPRAPASQPAPVEDSPEDAYDDVQRELMAYLGLEGEAIEAAPSPGPAAIEITGPLDVVGGPAVEAPPPPEPQPRFGGTAADSGILSGASAHESSPDWGRPTGPSLPADAVTMGDIDLPIEEPLQAEEVPLGAFGIRAPDLSPEFARADDVVQLPEVQPAEVAPTETERPAVRLPPPEAETEVAAKPPSAAPAPEPKPAVLVDDLFLGDEGADS